MPGRGHSALSHGCCPLPLAESSLEARAKVTVHGEKWPEWPCQWGSTEPTHTRVPGSPPTQALMSVRFVSAKQAGQRTIESYKNIHTDSAVYSGIVHIFRKAISNDLT